METRRPTWKWRALTWLVVAFVRLSRWRVEVEGVEHIPCSGGAVLAFNHHSYLDFVMVAWAPVRQLRRPIRFLAKREIWASRWVGWMARWVEAVPVDRTSGAARADAYTAAVDALTDGDLVVLAPEQTISTSFELLPFRTGAARMAQGAGVPIVPVVGWGSQRFATKGVGIRPAFGIPVAVRYGPPLDVGADEDPVAATRRLEEAMAVMLDEVQRESRGRHAGGRLVGPGAPRGRRAGPRRGAACPRATVPTGWAGGAVSAPDLPGPAAAQDPSASWPYRIAAWLAFTVMRLQRWRFDVRGLEHVPRSGGAVIASNHSSFWDFFTTGRPPYLRWGRPVRILAKASLFDTPVFGSLMRRAEHIPVHRGSGAGALRSAVSALRGGELVLVLPEQTISPSFELLAFKGGAARMAASAGVPLVPAVSWGSHRFHTVGRRPRWSWRLPVSIRYGPPLYPGPDDDPVVVTAELRRRVQRLLDEVQTSYPDGAPAGAWWVPARLGGGAPTPAEGETILARIRRGWAPRRAAS
jgi:1-acyl-sn-glycerol-3-phosphate acyltransferase